MPKVIYELPDGTSATVDVPVGTSVMDAAVNENLPGIDAECGGSCSCGTCHVHIDEAWYSVLGEPSDEERELLEFTAEYCERSRLSCQLVVTGECDGLRLTVPTREG